MKHACLYKSLRAAFPYMQARYAIAGCIVRQTIIVIYIGRDNHEINISNLIL